MIFISSMALIASLNIQCTEQIASFSSISNLDLSNTLMMLRSHDTYGANQIIAAGSKDKPPMLIAAGSKDKPPMLIAAGSKDKPPMLIAAGSKDKPPMLIAAGSKGKPPLPTTFI